jgi:hypothetical protein
VLHSIYVLTLNEIELLDGSGATISLNNFNTFDFINSLYDDIISVVHHSFVKLSRSNGRGGFLLICEDTHV